MNAATVEASSYLDFGGRGYGAVFCDERQHCYPMSQLPAVLSALPLSGDVFLSQQTFYKPSRCIVHLQQLGVCFADLETHKSEYSRLAPEHQAQALLLWCADQGVPRPTLVNSSGRGLHVKWCFVRPVPADALPRWNAVQTALLKALTPFCPDLRAKDAARILRVPGSINPRSQLECRTVWHDGPRWDFETLAFETLPIPREELQAKRKERREKSERKGNIGNLITAKELWWRRLADLRRLIALRGWQGGVPVGWRDAVLFIATCAVAWSAQPADLPAEVEALAQEFCPTLTLSEVRTYSKTAIRKAHEGAPYRFKSETLIGYLDITHEEERHMKTLLTLDERKQRIQENDRQRHRQNTDRATYEDNARQRREQARSLRAEGLSYRLIAERMDCTVPAVDKLLRSGRKAGSTQ